jgi:hypothetical protein
VGVEDRAHLVSPDVRLGAGSQVVGD